MMKLIKKGHHNFPEPEGASSNVMFSQSNNPIKVIQISIVSNRCQMSNQKKNHSTLRQDKQLLL